jgi:hypothetical protein
VLTMMAMHIVGWTKPVAEQVSGLGCSVRVALQSWSPARTRAALESSGSRGHESLAVLAITAMHMAVSVAQTQGSWSPGEPATRSPPKCDTQMRCDPNAITELDTPNVQSFASLEHLLVGGILHDESRRLSHFIAAALSLCVIAHADHLASDGQLVVDSDC